MPAYLTHSDVLTGRNLDAIRAAPLVFFDKMGSSATGYWNIPRLSDYQMYTKIADLLRECFVEIESTQRWSVMKNNCPSRKN